MIQQKHLSAVSKWLSRISAKHSDLGGHSICPFARMPQIVSVEKLCVEEFTELNDQLTIYMENDVHSSYDQLEDLCKQLKNMNPNFVFLPDHPHKISHINGHETGNGEFPCVIVQTKQELDSARAAMSKTDYYSYWDKSYLAEIHSFD